MIKETERSYEEVCRLRREKIFGGLCVRLALCLYQAYLERKIRKWEQCEFSVAQKAARNVEGKIFLRKAISSILFSLNKLNKIN